MSARNLNSPQQLWELFTEYEKSREWITITHPHVKLGTVDINVKEPMTMEGFKSYLWDIGIGCIKRYIDNADGNFEDYVPIVTRIKEKIFKNNFGYAAVGVYKENLIARQLGMTEKTESKNQNEHVIKEVNVTIHKKNEAGDASNGSVGTQS
jgi:hypothetical protein